MLSHWGLSMYFLLELVRQCKMRKMGGATNFWVHAHLQAAHITNLPRTRSALQFHTYFPSLSLSLSHTHTHTHTHTHIYTHTYTHTHAGHTNVSTVMTHFQTHSHLCLHHAIHAAIYDDALEVLFDTEFVGGGTLNGRVTGVRV